MQLMKFVSDSTACTVNDVVLEVRTLPYGASCGRVTQVTK